MISVRLWVLVGLIGIGPGAYGQEQGRKIDICPWKVPGQYEATVEMAMDQAMTVDGQVQPKQRMEQMLVTRITVGEPRPDGGRVLEVAFTRIKQVAKRGGETLSYDSDGEEAKQNEQLAQAYKPLLAVKMTVVIGPDGQVEEVTGLEAFWKKLAEANPEAAETIKEMQKQMGDSMVKEVISKGRELVPAGGVVVGQPWKNDRKVAVPFVGEVRLVQDGELTKVERTNAGEVAVIEYKGKMTLPKNAGVQVGAVSLKFLAFEMHQEGQLLYNLDAGLTDASLTQEAKMELSGRDERGKTVDIAIRQEGTVKVSTRKLGPATAPTSKPAGEGGRP